MADGMESNGTGIGKIPSLVLGTESGSQLRLLSICRHLKICMIARIADLGTSVSFFLQPTSAMRDASPLAILSSRCAGCKTDC